MSKALISILMPVKNTANFLPDCLNTILQQTERNWELLAVNDHSTDNSLQILQDFARCDARIKVFDNDGNGIIAALRLAYAQSQGSWITRMDSDDLMMPQKLAVLKQQLLVNGKGYLATGQVHYFSEVGIGEGYQKYQDWLNRLTEKGINFQELYKECVIPSPCWMIHREDLEKCAAFRPDRYPEDYDLCFRFYKYGLKVIPNDQLLHQWRDYPNRTSRTDKNYSDNRFLAIKLHYFLQLDFDDKYPLILWGAGKKGKWLARQLVDQKVPYQWVCDNEKKIGKTIYGQRLLPWQILTKLELPQIIISVAGAIPQQEIRSFLLTKNWMPGKEYFFFC